MNSLRTGEFFVAKAPGRWVSVLWRSSYLCSGITSLFGWILQPVMSSKGRLPLRNPRAQIGSGTESKAASIEVRRPSGIVQTLADVLTGQFLKIEEPAK